MKLHNLFVLLLAAVLFACGGSKSEETASAEETTQEEASMALLTDGQYKVADGSQLMWEGKKVAYGHNGTINVSSGAFSVSEGALAAGEFTVDMASIVDSDIEDDEKRGNLEGHLKSADFFDAEQFPTATFTLKSAAPSTEEGATHSVTGDLTLKGETNEITFPATISQEGDAISVAASFNIDRTRWNVEFNSPQFPAFANLAADKIINDEIKIEFSLTANKAEM